MRDLQSLQLKLQSGMRLMCGPRWAQGGAREFRDPFGRLYMIHGGEGMVIHSGRHFHLRPVYLFVIPAHVMGRYRCPKQMDLSFVHFAATVHGCLEPFAFNGWDTVAAVDEWTDAEKLMALAVAGANDATPQAALTADGAMRMLLSRFAREQHRRSPSARFAPVFHYIDQHLGKRLTLKELAAQVHLQPNYFSNRFAEVAGIPPMRFVNRRRIEAVATELRATEQSLGDLAAEYGFSDAFHLSKIFKRFMGVSPSIYRRNAWREDSDGAQPV